MRVSRSASRMHRLYVIVLLCVWVPIRGPAQDRSSPPVPEARLKAAFLYHLPQFVKGPDAPASASEGGGEYRVGILGAADVRTALAELIKARTDGRTLKLVDVRSLRDAESCHMLFLNGSDALLIRRILQHVATRPILTVGEDPAFIRWGGALRFMSLGERLRLEASPSNARRAGLRLSAQLLEVCQVTDAEPKPPESPPASPAGTSPAQGGSQ